MCGILGVYATNPQPDVLTRLEKGIAAMRHRGPDDCGQAIFSVEGGTLALGHTRLSIIDLSAGGRQPMHSADGRFTIVFNGEIYNYRELRMELKARGHPFHTDSDTEVLLACWENWSLGCLPRLRGMFAFAVFDRHSNKLTLARDAFGIKPLYYRLSNDGFIFASEVPTLLTFMQQRPKLNPQSAYDYLVHGQYDRCAESFFEGVSHLLPGHVLELDLDSLREAEIQRWWWPSIDERRDLSFRDAAEQLRAMFLDNVRLHLRSDVPVGAALSGGVDSSAVVCAMRHVEPDMPIHTFSFVARGSYADEEMWADLVNTHVGANAHKVVITPEELAEDLDDLHRAQGEPFGSTSIYAQYRVFKLARAQGITVTLDGQGADELLAGYGGFSAPRMRSMIETGKIIELVRFVIGCSKRPGRSLRKSVRMCVGQSVPNNIRDTLRGAQQSSPPGWLNVDVFQSMGVKFTSPHRAYGGDPFHGRRLVESLRQSLSGGGLNSLLRHGDRNAMRWSVESRVPFLTTDMAEFLLSLPEQYLLSGEGETKHIFRAAMRGIVPDTILDRRDKIGFATSEQAWLRQLGGTAVAWTEEARNVPFLNEENTRAEIQAVIDGKAPFSFHAWRLMNFCRWVALMEPSFG